MQHMVNVFLGEAGSNSSFIVQQGEYNSREIVCAIYQKCPGGGRVQLKMNTGEYTVMVVYRYGSSTSPEYPTKVVGDNEISFVIPQIVLNYAGKAEFQLKVYSDTSLLNSAIVPFKILGSIPPASMGPDDVEPELLGILAEVRDVLQQAEENEKARQEAEKERQEAFEKWEQLFNNGEYVQQVYNAQTHFEFPSVGSPNVIYKAEAERKIYQWNQNGLMYETISESPGGDLPEFDVIYGGDANGN